MTGLERGYRRLLRAYPAWYRRERGEEMLDTLVAAAPHGRTWPSLRESGALILGGLRVRARQNHRLTTIANLRLAVLFGVALWLTWEASRDLAFANMGLQHTAPSGQNFPYDFWFVAVCGVVTLAAVVSAWFAPRPVVGAIALIAVAMDAYNPWQAPGWQGIWWRGPWWLLGEPAMLVALALLAPGKERMPRSWLWLIGAELAQTVTWLPVHRLFFLFGLLNDLPWLIVAAVVLWAVVDARPAIAVGISVALGRAIRLAPGGWFDTMANGDHVFFWPLALGAALALVMAVRVRRQAVL